MDVLQRTSRRCVAVSAPVRQQALGTRLEGKAAIVTAFAFLAVVAARGAFAGPLLAAAMNLFLDLGFSGLTPMATSPALVGERDVVV